MNKMREQLETTADKLRKLSDEFFRTGVGVGYLNEIEREIRTAIANHSDPSVPEGWKLVPIDPDSAMMFAGAEVLDIRPSQVAKVYKAALAAAPEVPR